MKSKVKILISISAIVAIGSLSVIPSYADNKYSTYKTIDLNKDKNTCIDLSKEILYKGSKNSFDNSNRNCTSITSIGKHKALLNIDGNITDSSGRSDVGFKDSNVITDSSKDSSSTTPLPAYVTGNAKNMCSLPNKDSLQGIYNSGIRAINVYLGGENASCLNGVGADYITYAESIGLHLYPLYVGLQPSCVSDDFMKMDSAGAQKEGQIDAQMALKIAYRQYGFIKGSTIYSIMVGYDSNNKECRDTLKTYLSAYTDYLHTAGYYSGFGTSAYSLCDLTGPKTDAHCGSNIDPSDTAWVQDSSFNRPDSIAIYEWDNIGGNTNSDWISDTTYTHNQRIKEYNSDGDAYIDGYVGITG